MLAIDRLRSQGVSKDDADEEVLGFTINQLSRKLAMHWHLPPLAAESLGRDIFSQRPLCVMLASALARATCTGWDNEEAEEMIEYTKEFLPIDSDQTHALIHQLAAETARQLAFTKLPLAILTMPMIPASDAPKRSKPEPAPVARKKPKVEPQQSRPVNPRINSGIDHLLQHMHKKLSLSRCMFVALNPDSGQLKAYHVCGNNQGPLHAFAADINSRNLLQLLLSKPSHLWLKKDNRPKYQSLMPEAAKDAWSNNDSLIMSFFFKGRAMGLFYADNDGRELNERQYAHFKAGVNKLAQTLNNSL
jgi:hypothetical protein